MPANCLTARVKISDGFREKSYGVDEVKLEAPEIVRPINDRAGR